MPSNSFTCVIAIIVAIGTAALIAAAVLQCDTEPSRYWSKNPRCTKIPATEPYFLLELSQWAA
jgi:hypothetical protein